MRAAHRVALIAFIAGWLFGVGIHVGCFAQHVAHIGHGYAWRENSHSAAIAHKYRIKFKVKHNTNAKHITAVFVPFFNGLRAVNGLGQDVFGLFD